MSVVLIGPLLGAIAVLAGAGAVVLRSDPVISERLAPAGSAGPESRHPSIAAWIGTRAWARRLVRPDDAAARIGATGWQVGPDTLAGWKILAAAAGLAVGIVSPPPLVVATPLFVVAGFRGPDFIGARAAARRSRRADLEVPQLLDLLAAGSTAGLSAPIALRRAATAVGEPLAGELRSVLAAVELGSRWRDELKAMAARLGLPDLKRAVLVIGRTETLGSSLADALRELAEDVRDARRARAAELARKAPVKMLFPLVFMILPAFLLLTVVPVLFSTLRSIR